MWPGTSPGSRWRRHVETRARAKTWERGMEQQGDGQGEGNSLDIRAAPSLES